MAIVYILKITQITRSSSENILKRKIEKINEPLPDTRTCHYQMSVHIWDIVALLINCQAHFYDGSLEILIHNGQVVQLERREKKRWRKLEVTK